MATSLFIPADALLAKQPRRPSDIGSASRLHWLISTPEPSTPSKRPPSRSISRGGWLTPFRSKRPSIPRGRGCVWRVAVEIGDRLVSGIESLVACSQKCHQTLWHGALRHPVRRRSRDRRQCRAASAMSAVRPSKSSAMIDPAISAAFPRFTRAIFPAYLPDPPLHLS